MIKVASITPLEDFKLLCKFNNGEVKIIDIKPILENHKHLEGIQNIYDTNVFKKVKVGQLGQIVWEQIITIRNNGKQTIWDYDISPEFAYYLNQNEYV